MPFRGRGVPWGPVVGVGSTKGMGSWGHDRDEADGRGRGRPQRACGPWWSCLQAALGRDCGDWLSTGDVAGTRLSPVPLLLAFPPPGPHLCSEELVETVLLPAFAVRHKCPRAEGRPKSPSSGTFCPTGRPSFAWDPEQGPSTKALGGLPQQAAPWRRSQAEGRASPGMRPQPCVASSPFQAGVSLNS